MTQDFFLTSRDSGAWLPVRRCRVVDVVEGQAGRSALLVELDPAGPRDERLVLLQPRYADEASLTSADGRPVIVNVRQHRSRDPEAPPGGRLSGIGTLWSTRGEAEGAAQDEMARF